MVIRVDGSHEMAVTRGGGSLFALNQKLPLEAVSRKACGYGYCFHMGYLHKLLSGEAKISSQVIFCGAWKTNQEKRGQTVPGSLARSTFRPVRQALRIRPLTLIWVLINSRLSGKNQSLFCTEKAVSVIRR